MRVEVEGRRLNVTAAGLLRMAREGKIQPWFSIKSDELTNGEWAKAGELDFFAGVWAQREDLARYVGATKRPQVVQAQGRRRRARPADKSPLASAAAHPSTVFAQAAEKPLTTAGGVTSFELHGIQVSYRVSCSKCKSTLTKLGVTNCPRCGKKIAASKQLYWLKKVLYSAGMIIIFAGAALLKKFGQWAKYIYPLAGILLALLSVIARGAKLLVAIWINGHVLPPREITVPLGEYYSKNAWPLLAKRITSLFRLNAILRRMAEREELGTETGPSPHRP